MVWEHISERKVPSARQNDVKRINKGDVEDDFPVIDPDDFPVIDPDDFPVIDPDDFPVIDYSAPVREEKDWTRFFMVQFLVRDVSNGKFVIFQ